ncbi:hypothetical protein J2787_000868 [Chryseobacterium rhizosphaerae]|uniref:Uncharacterized protein n=1 Tax=Chryseobacterium rhizosphaerae TaxID=395937 RepID=A0AAE4C1I1_9FLAO|nr:MULTISPECIES: hypothetical protein [Chryseobacterium]MBL3550540.1 hypothetical protein [Chryseobacterium sp. KMC2]MDR6525498.1 hypothetical protein [Chryseobacterium rhizosphaerae]
MAPTPPDIITKILIAKAKTYESGTMEYSRKVSMTMTLLIYNPENLDLSKAGLSSQGVMDWKEFRGNANRVLMNGKILQDDYINNLSVVYKD